MNPEKMSAEAHIFGMLCRLGVRQIMVYGFRHIFLKKRVLESGVNYLKQGFPGKYQVKVQTIALGEL